ncbi:hypothetical protein [Phytoactinopolyspora limicola]|uniref:hypothetical protein n=1 Tax=Phytoactinopolyspora limicola TaxID=2715536 RepID=UPI001408DAB4|nr:hypothetical protein [Phytoactinopolyspora limicola]
MTDTILIYGASDDLVEVQGCRGAEEFSHYDQGPWRADLIAPNGEQMRVHVLFDGCWHVAVGQVDEDVPLPQWPLRFEQGQRGDGSPGYSVVLCVDAPDGTRLTNVSGGGSS